MSLTGKIILEGRYSKSDGSKAIKFRYTINRISVEIPSGYTIDPKYWNDKKSEIKATCPTLKNVSRLNHHLQKLFSDYQDKLYELDQNGQLKSLSPSQIKNVLTNKSDNNNVLAFTNNIIEELSASGRIGNAKTYKTLWFSLKKFLNDIDIPLRNITFKWIKSYEAWYLGKGNSVNGLSVHLRTLRAVINRAIKENILKKDEYPFENYSIKSKKTQKRAITEEDLMKIKNFKPKTKQQERAKNYFMMSFYLMGASFIDIAYLKMKDIIQGRIEYRRKKTGQLHSIKITPALQFILDQYIINKKPDDFILNIIKSDDDNEQYFQVREELMVYNKRIKEIGKICGIEQPLSSYVARHSFATIAKFKDVPISVISQALGHQDAKTTEIYLSEFSNEVLDQYNEKIINL